MEKSTERMPKRLRSPRKFAASPSSRRSKRALFNFKEQQTEEASPLATNLFNVCNTSENENVHVGDRYIPSRTSNFNEALLINQSKALGSPEASNIIGVSGLKKASPATEASHGSGNSSTIRKSESFDLFVRDEMLSRTQLTPLSRVPERRCPGTPRKQPRASVFRYSASQGRTLDFNAVVSTQTVSPLTSFTTMDRYQELFSASNHTKRKIHKHPFKILDAPSLKDDYYLNLLDWSSQNVLAVALSSSVYLWNATTTKVDLLVDIDENSSIESENKNIVTSVAWSPDGRALAFGTKRGRIQIWDVASKKLIRILKGHSARVGALSWGSFMLASGSRDKTVHRRDIREKAHSVDRLVGHKQEVCGLKWSFDNKQLASGGNDNKLLIWDAHTETPLWKFSNYHQAAVKAVAWSPHENGLLATGGGTADRCIKFWNTLTGAHLNSLDTGSQVCSLMWSKSVNELVSTHGYSLNNMIVWKYPSMSKVATLNGHTFRVLYMSMSPDGQTVVTGAGDERLCFWNLFPCMKNKPRISNTLLFPKSFSIR